MGQHAVSVVSTLYDLRQSSITEPCQPMLCSTEQSKLLDIGFRNASEKSVISEQGEPCMIWTVSYIQICLYQIYQETVLPKL